MLVRTECRLRLQTTSSGSKLQLECGLWAGDPALRSRIPGVSMYGGVQETLGLWESVVETLWGGANSTLCSGIVRLWPSVISALPLLSLMILSLVLFLFIVEFLKVLHYPLFFFYSTFLNCMRLYILPLLVYLLVAVCTVLSYPSIGLGREVEGGLVLAGEECQGVRRGLVERGGGDT